jgi:hypothetical protein
VQKGEAYTEPAKLQSPLRWLDALESRDIAFPRLSKGSEFSLDPALVLPIETLQFLLRPVREIDLPGVPAQSPSSFSISSRLCTRPALWSSHDSRTASSSS